MLSWGSVTNSFRTSWEMRSCERSVAVVWAAPDVRLAASIRVKLDTKALFIEYPYPKNSKRHLEVAFQPTATAEMSLHGVLAPLFTIHSKLRERLETIVCPGGTFRFGCSLVIELRMILC